MAHELPVASAQVKTALLLAGLQAEGRTTVREPMPSRDHTERMLAGLRREGRARGPRRRASRAAAARAAPTVDVPGDASSAAFLVVAALILPDSELRLEGVLLSPTRTAFLDVLRAMGGRVEVLAEPERARAGGHDRGARRRALVGTRVDPALVPSLIDEVPALAVAGRVRRGCARGNGRRGAAAQGDATGSRRSREGSRRSACA